MATYQFNYNGRTFNVSGPAGLTLEQAQQAFNIQTKTGALDGLKAGDSINAASQAAAGVQGALAQTTQYSSGVTGALGGGLSTSTGILGSITGAGGAISNIVSSVTSTIKNFIGSTSITNGINSASFAKTVSAVAPLAGLNQSQVTGTLSAVSGLVNQASSLMSNSKGVGNFGLDVKQLEKAGFLKPGTSNFVTGFGSGTLTSVLKSPNVFTGKDGITSINGILNNPSLQSVTQQELMAGGISKLGAQGIDVAKLPIDLQGGVASIASKSIEAATSLAKGALSGVSAALSKLTSSFPSPSSILKDCGFATNFVSNFLSDGFKEQETPVPAVDTASRATVDAATNRIIGNPKIPTPDYTSPLV